MIWYIGAGWTLCNRLYIGLTISMDKCPVTRTKATTRASQLSREGWEAGNGPAGFPPRFMLEHGTATQDNHGWCSGRVAPRQGPDAFSSDTGERLSPFGCKGGEVICECLKAHGMSLYKIRISQSFLDEHVGQC